MNKDSVLQTIYEKTDGQNYKNQAKLEILFFGRFGPKKQDYHFIVQFGALSLLICRKTQFLFINIQLFCFHLMISFLYSVHLTILFSHFFLIKHFNFIFNSWVFMQ